MKWRRILVLNYFAQFVSISKQKLYGREDWKQTKIQLKIEWNASIMHTLTTIK